MVRDQFTVRMTVRDLGITLCFVWDRNGNPRVSDLALLVQYDPGSLVILWILFDDFQNRPLESERCDRYE